MICGAKLFDGEHVGVCLQDRYDDHEHGRYSVREAVKRGLARPATFADSEVWRDPEPFARQFLSSVGLRATLPRLRSSIFGIYNAWNSGMTVPRLRKMRGTHDRQLAVRAFKYMRHLDVLDRRAMDRVSRQESRRPCSLENQLKEAL